MNLDRLIEAIAEQTLEAIRDWDIYRAIDEVRRNPEILKLKED